MPADFVAQQLESVLSDIGTDAAKTGKIPSGLHHETSLIAIMSLGMLFNAEIIGEVVKYIRKYSISKLVGVRTLRLTRGSRRV